MYHFHGFCTLSGKSRLSRAYPPEIIIPQSRKGRKGKGGGEISGGYGDTRQSPSSNFRRVQVCNQNPTFYIVDCAISRAESHYPDVKPFKILIKGLALWFYQTRGSGCKPEPAKRRTFHDWAFTSINCSPWARAYYDYHKERDQSHGTILRNLGKKWTKILFTVWSQGTSYDETLHIQNLKARNVPWAMAL